MIRVEDFDKAAPTTPTDSDIDTVELAVLKVKYDAMLELVETYEKRLREASDADNKFVVFIIILVLAVTWAAGFVIGYMV